MTPFTFPSPRQVLSFALLMFTLSITGHSQVQTPPTSAGEYIQSQVLGNGAIVNAAWQPDSDRFIVNSHHGASLYSLEFEALASVPNSAFALPGADAIAVVLADFRTVQIWDAEMREAQTTLAIPLSEAEKIQAIAWSPDKTSLTTHPEPIDKRSIGFTLPITAQNGHYEPKFS